MSIDGKQMRRSGEQGNKAIIHMVSAWSNANNMVLGQLKVNDKSNEITAIPALLEILLLKGCWVTIDAIGCQTEIAQKIKEVGAEYILAVKDNQKHLHDDIVEAFEQTPQAVSHVQKNVDHGRIEKRTWRVITDMDWICNKDQCFNEDVSTKQAGNAAENFSFVSKAALNLLNQSDEKKAAKNLA